MLTVHKLYHPQEKCIWVPFDKAYGQAVAELIAAFAGPKRDQAWAFADGFWRMLRAIKRAGVDCPVNQATTWGEYLAAWTAGLFDAEGNCQAVDLNSMILSVEMKTRTVPDAMMAAWGCGQVYPTYQDGMPKVFVWVVSDTKLAKKILQRILPFLHAKVRARCLFLPANQPSFLKLEPRPTPPTRCRSPRPSC